MYIKRFKPNLRGRDFVCGDIHGSMSCVEQFLLGIDFDSNHDRLFCAGDLVDRGPRNEECLDLLYEPWFHMCKGNHELLMEQYFTGHPQGLWWGPNGGSWGLHYESEMSDMGLYVRGVVEDIISKLPHLMTVEKKDGGVFHVLHAELAATRPITDETLSSEDTLKEFSEVQTMDGSFINWGRWIFAPLYNKHLDEHALAKFRRRAQLEKAGVMFNDKLSHIYSGHTCVRQPVTFRGQTNLDTQAYKSYRGVPNHRGEIEYEEYCGLSVAEPATGKFWFVNDRVFKEVEPIIIEE